jgi:membrane protein YdbS with pleckstrin-like domain
LERPDARLMTYYLLSALVIPPLFPFAILPLYFRYHTLRYRFDEEGVSMRWGILFRREIVLNYSRLQDIQIRANLLERWLGLARIELQTAAGSSGAEMTLEGFPNFAEIRDFLYERMRGAKGHGPRSSPPRGPGAAGTAGTAGGPPPGDELAGVLREVTAEIRALREDLAGRPPRRRANRCVTCSCAGCASRPSRSLRTEPRDRSRCSGPPRTSTGWVQLRWLAGQIAGAGRFGRRVGGGAPVDRAPRLRPVSVPATPGMGGVAARDRRVGRVSRPDPVTFLVARLEYELRWYLVTDRSLRIRSGIWTVEELTMTFANIQELTIRQGPLQRMLGIADLKVRSAGGGAAQQEGKTLRETHVGYFHGVDNAPALRDLILAQLRRYRDSGLGDPDEPAAVAPTGAVDPAADPSAAATAARELLAEVRTLRRTLGGS